MGNSYFKFKQFTVHQDKTAMKVGTDGVLIGAWAKTCNVTRILDVGSGTGLIALMLAQRTNGSKIVALEIDESAYLQAKKNFQESGWNNRLHIFHQSFQQYCKDANGKYNLIVSNPPYFNNSKKNNCRKKSKARHTDSLSYDELIQGSCRLLDKAGILCVILPADERDRFTALANKHLLYLQECLGIKPTPEKPAKRIMMSFGYNKVEVLEEEMIIEAYGRHGYSEAYKELTKDFYLAF